MNKFIRDFSESNISVKVKTTGIRKASTILCKSKTDVETLIYRLPKECSVKKIILPSGKGGVVR